MGIKRKTTEIFKNEIYNKYNGEYTVLGEYINNKTPILVKHNKCNTTFMVRPDIFLNNYKKGCPLCSDNKKLKNHDQFISEVRDIYGDEYTVLDKYVNADTLISVRHNLCGCSRLVLPHRLLKGDRCVECFGSRRKTLTEFKSDLARETFNQISLLSQEYKNNKSKMLFKCNICGREFEMTPNNILSGHGCPHCNRSKAETKIRNILEKYGIIFTEQKAFKNLYYKNSRNKLRFDFEIVLKNGNTILLEFDGEQHYHPCGRFTIDEVNEIKLRDTIKNKYCIDHNLTLIRVPYTKYNKIYSIIEKIICSTTIPDEFKVVDPSGSKYSATIL